jgi:hypothetical protein
MFWDLTPYSPLKVNGSFGGHITSVFMVEVRNQHEVGIAKRRDVPPKRLLIFSELHGFMYEKIGLFITTAVRISNLT